MVSTCENQGMITKNQNETVLNQPKKERKKAKARSKLIEITY